MAKYKVFHQAVITVMVKTTDGNRSYGTEQFQLAALYNTPEEWLAMQAEVERNIQALNAMSDKEEDASKVVPTPDDG